MAEETLFRPWTPRTTPRLTPADVADILAQLANEAHRDQHLDYASYLQRLQTLRRVSQALDLPLADATFAVRPSRG